MVVGVAAVALTVFLALWNNLANRVPGFGRLYVPVNLALAAGLLTVARLLGLSPEALGLAPEAVGAGLRWGGAAAAVVAVALGIALNVPRLRPLLADPRAADPSTASFALYVVARIPLGTVVLEEVAFRGLLLALWRPAAVGVAVSSVVFGLWHVVPTLHLADLRGTPRTATTVAGVAFTAVAGVLFCALRLVSGSLLAPALLHLATNCLGAIAARAARLQAAPGRPTGAGPAGR